MTNEELEGRIDKLWLVYFCRTYPKGCPLLQASEMRKAFVAAAMAMMSASMKQMAEMVIRVTQGKMLEQQPTEKVLAEMEKLLNNPNCWTPVFSKIEEEKKQWN